MSSLIRISVDRWIFAPNHSFSQLIASFFGNQCPGIHPALLFAWSCQFYANILSPKTSWNRLFAVFVLSLPVQFSRCGEESFDPSKRYRLRKPYFRFRSCCDLWSTEPSVLFEPFDFSLEVSLITANQVSFIRNYLDLGIRLQSSLSLFISSFSP